MFKSLRVLIISWYLIVSGILATVVTSDVRPIERIAFGSCHKLWLENEVWDSISKLRPDMFIFTGDAVYSRFSRGTDSSRQKKDLEKLKRSAQYQRFLATEVRVIGTHDDHDYCGNDRGKYCLVKEESKVNMLEFLDAPQADPRWERAGMYTNYLLGADNNTVNIILLDTRSFRDDNCLFPSPGTWELPFSAVLAAILRLLIVNLGYCESYGGSFLGEEQWRWLEGIFRTSKARHHILVSSVQVLTSNSMVESWGHFPMELRRLVGVLRRTTPSNLFILSGDVHFAEALGAKGEILEFTSSGLTHSIGTTFHSPASIPIASSYDENRVKDFFYTAPNFGFLSFDWKASNQRRLLAELYDSSGRRVFWDWIPSLGIDWLERIPDDMKLVKKWPAPVVFCIFFPLLVCFTLVICLRSRMSKVKSL